MKKTVLFSIFCFCIQAGYAQDFFSWQYNDRYFSLLAGTGHTRYFGELNNGAGFEQGLSNGSLEVECRLLSQWAARVGAVYYTVSGSDANAPDSSFNRQRNLSFKSGNIEGHLSGLYYFKPYRKYYHQRRKFEPYAHAGIGFTTVNPKAGYNGDWVKLRPLATEGAAYKGTTIVVPFGLGVKARITSFINLVGEVGYRYAFTDRLDDVSENYGEFFDSSLAQSLSNRKDEVGVINQEAYDAMVAGSERGEPGRDSYLLIQWKIEAYLPRGIFRNGLNKPFTKPSAF